MKTRANSARALAASVVARVLQEGAFLGKALDSALSHANLEPRDKAFATELAYGAVRWAGPLERSLLRGADKPGRGIDKKLLPHLLVAAYQLQHLDERVPAHAAVNECVSLVRQERPGLAGFANALLRRLGSAPHLQLAAGASIEELTAAYGVPAEVVAYAVDGVDGSERQQAVAAFNARPPLALRYLGPAASRDQALAALREIDPAIRPHPFVPEAFLVEAVGVPSRLPGFAEGLWLVQDPGSQLCALLVAPAAGDVVLDLCAAPGGKSVVLARAAGERGRTLAVERDPARARLIAENARRIGVAIDVTVADGTALPADVPGRVDAVLLDAPCSGLGTLRRHPEIRLRRRSTDLEELGQLQRRLLDAAAARVRPGGALVYSVCSPLPQEGHAVVEEFLSARSDFVVRSASDVLPWLPDDAVTPAGYLRLQVHRHEADAFFAVRLEKAPEV
ncbi:MAG: RsmB/NOP family class I SAM-dependent RNA methyltransferase [Myxococcota bacterium]